MEVSAAEKYLNVKKIKVLKRIGVPHLAFERGVKGRGPPEYWSYEYVYCLAKAPDGWVASTEYDISLADWCKLCDHYSHNENRISPSGEFKDLFEKYTGCEASAANINLAYNDNVLVSPSDLPQKAAKVVTPPKKTKVAGTKKKVTDKKKVAASRKVKCRGFQSKVVTAYARTPTILSKLAGHTLVTAGDIETVRWIRMSMNMIVVHHVIMQTNICRKAAIQCYLTYTVLIRIAPYYLVMQL